MSKKLVSNFRIERLTWLSCVESVTIMDIKPIQTTNNKRNNSHIMLSSAVGAAVGAGARYIVPTKTELNQLINKDAVDTFVSNTATAARGSKRSILKYGGIGAAIAAGLSVLAKAFSSKNREALEYSKYAALMDTPADSAYAIMWYGE